MPAPAVIPAPKAYINAVAVKGFVVELWTSRRCVTPFHLGFGARSLLVREQFRNKKHGSGSFRIFACHACPGAPVIFTVTKEARPKQSFDLN